MNFSKAEIEKKAAEYARQLLKYAKTQEPQISEDLQKIAAEVAAEMVGLECKFKSEESLTRKISDESAKSTKSIVDFGYSVDESIEKSTTRQAKRNNDTLRYTFLFPLEKYVFGFRQTVERLIKKGYTVPENKSGMLGKTSERFLIKVIAA